MIGSWYKLEYILQKRSDMHQSKKNNLGARCARRASCMLSCKIAFSDRCMSNFFCNTHAAIKVARGSLEEAQSLPSIPCKGNLCRGWHGFREVGFAHDHPGCWWQRLVCRAIGRGLGRLRPAPIAAACRSPVHQQSGLLTRMKLGMLDSMLSPTCPSDAQAGYPLWFWHPT